jgi:hypothetical protein
MLGSSRKNMEGSRMTTNNRQRSWCFAIAIAVLMGGSFSAEAQDDFEYRCVIVDTPTAADQATSLPTGIAEASIGSTLNVEYWATDSGATNSGIVSAYADMAYPSNLVTCGTVTNSATFNLFPGGTCGGAVIDELGGSQLNGGVAVEPQWVRIASVEFMADAAGSADFDMSPAVSESSAFGRGLIAADAISYGQCSVAITPPPVVQAGTLDFQRVLAMVLPTETSGQQTAVRVKLSSLYHPEQPFPTNLSDYAAYEGEFRYLNFLRDSNDQIVTSCLSSAAFQLTYRCATLGCDPEYADWSGIFGEEELFVSGNAVLPDSVYHVAHLPVVCIGAEETCMVGSKNVEFSTARHGDANGEGGVNITDVVQTVDRVKDMPGALPEYFCYIRNPDPKPNLESVNVTDVVTHVDALKLTSYVLPVFSCP